MVANRYGMSTAIRYSTHKKNPAISGIDVKKCCLRCESVVRRLRQVRGVLGNRSVRLYDGYGNVSYRAIRDVIEDAGE